MGAAEFDEWVAYSRIEPFGDRRADQRAWLGVAALSNVHRGARQPAIELAQVLPEWRLPEPVAADGGWGAFLAQMNQLAQERG